MKTIRLLAILEATSITGPAKNLLQFAQCARERGAYPGVEVSIAVFRREGQSNLLLETAGRLGIPVHALPEAGRFDRAVIPGLRSLASELKPDLIQSHAVKSHFLVRAARLDRGAPWVAFHHGYTWPDLRARVYNRLDRWSLRTAKRVLTVSEPFRRELIGRGVAPERIEVVHNAIDPQWGRRDRNPEAAEALRAKLGIGQEKRVVLIVGRLSSEKDHRTLLEAMRRLPEAHLVIVGDGPERPRIEETVRALGLGESVTLVGQVPSAEPYYGIADICVLSSLSEGSPNALLEAMAAGVPVVATAVGGVPEMVSHGESALLIQKGDCPAMTGAIAALLADGELARRLAAKAREVILERFAPAPRTRKLVEIYGELVTSNAEWPRPTSNPRRIPPAS
jgi:glycosyltransferase involved in cell wall biosynthesis